MRRKNYNFAMLCSQIIIEKCCEFDIKKLLKFQQRLYESTEATLTLGVLPFCDKLHLLIEKILHL